MSLINLIEAEKYRAGNTSVWNIALQKAIEIIRQHQAEPPQDTAERIRVAVNKWVLEPNGLGKNGGKTMVNCDFDILIKMITQAMGASGLMASTGDGGVCGNKTNTAFLEAPTIIDYADADKIAQRDDVAAMKNYTPADKTANRETGISNLGDARGSGSLPDGVATNSTLIDVRETVTAMQVAYDKRKNMEDAFVIAVKAHEPFLRCSEIPVIDENKLYQLLETLPRTRTQDVTCSVCNGDPDPYGNCIKCGVNGHYQASVEIPYNERKEIWLRALRPYFRVPARESSKHLPPETKNRLEQLEAHMDEGGKTDNSIVYELLGYIKELTANGE